MGRGTIEDMIVTEVPADVPAVVAMIFRDEYRNKPVPRVMVNIPISSNNVASLPGKRFFD